MSQASPKQTNKQNKNPPKSKASRCQRKESIHADTAMAQYTTAVNESVDSFQAERRTYRQPGFWEPPTHSNLKRSLLGCWEEIDLSLLWSVPTPGDWTSGSWPDQLSCKQARSPGREAGARLEPGSLAFYTLKFGQNLPQA